MFVNEYFNKKLYVLLMTSLIFLTKKRFYIPEVLCLFVTERCFSHGSLNNLRKNTKISLNSILN